MNPTERVGWIAVYVLAALNVIAFGILLFKFLWPWFTGPHTDVLLLDGLRDQHKRLEILVEAPCGSPDLERYQRGEIGPVIRSEAPAQYPSPAETLEPGTATVPGTEPPATSSNPPETAPTEPPPASPPSNSTTLSGGDILPPAKLRELVEHSVVRVLAVQGTEVVMTGTGFAISPDTIVTNRHVVAGTNDDQFFIVSKYLGEEPVKAKLLTKTANAEFGDPDFAVLRLENGKPLTPLNIGGNPKPLDSVVAAGFPGVTIQLDRNDTIPDVVYSQGDVSVVQPQSNGVSLVIHTANIAPGSSGGPLINRCGTLVGVNTFVHSGERSEGRILYALSGKSLAEFLKDSTISFSTPSAGECGSGAN